MVGRHDAYKKDRAHHFTDFGNYWVLYAGAARHKHFSGSRPGYLRQFLVEHLTANHPKDPAQIAPPLKARLHLSNEGKRKETVSGKG